MSIHNHQEPLGELKQIFVNKILPLLQEYFYGDWGKIGLVIGNEFVKKENDTVKFLSDGIDEEYEEYSEKPVEISAVKWEFQQLTGIPSILIMMDDENDPLWIKRHQITLDIYIITKQFPPEDMFRLAVDMRRTCTQIPNNVIPSVFGFGVVFVAKE